MLVACLLQYSDTQSYGVAAIFGLIQDLKLYSFTPDFHLDLHKYQWSTSIANFGSMFVYFASEVKRCLRWQQFQAQYPLLIIAQFLPLGKFTSVMVLYSGLLALLFIVWKDFADIVALRYARLGHLTSFDLTLHRFFYGFQLVTTPLFIMICAMWYVVSWFQSQNNLLTSISEGGKPKSSLSESESGPQDKHSAASSDKELTTAQLASMATLQKVLGSGSMWFLGLWQWALASSWCGSSRILQWKALSWPNGRKKSQSWESRKTIPACRRESSRRNNFFEAFKDPQLYILCIIGFSFVFANGALGR